MANDLTTLNGHLDTMLRESTTDNTWTSTEKNNVLGWVMAQLEDKFVRPLDPTASGNQITLVAETYYYSLPTGCIHVSRVDYATSDGKLRGPLGDGSWEVVGDVKAGTGKLHVAPVYVNGGDELWINGYGKYDLTTNLPLDSMVPLILAMARAELYRRLASDRQLFKTWLARNQDQNVSINELLQMINEADNEVQRLLVQTPRSWKMPVPGRIR